MDTNVADRVDVEMWKKGAAGTFVAFNSPERKGKVRLSGFTGRPLCYMLRDWKC